MSKAQATLNAEIAAFIERKDAAGESYTLEDINYIQQFTGDGGQGTETRGALYEYYTPNYIIEKMWGLVFDNGFTSGNILEPSCGIGRFLRYVDPAVSSVTAYEYSKDTTTGFRIAQISYPFVNFINNYFETIFYKDNKRVGAPADFDLAIGNPPYGAFDGKYSGSKREGGIFPGRTYDQYFIWAAIQLLKPGGLVCFIIPSSFLENDGSYEEFKTELETQAELIDAYRLPRGVFDFTEIQPDIVLFRKK